MRKLHIFGLIGLAAIIIGLAWAEEITFTTYYPAPYGVYNDMRVMNSLGVGTTAPEAVVHIVNDVQTSETPWNTISAKFVNDGTSSNIVFRKARGDFSNPLDVQGGDALGRIHFTGFMDGGFAQGLDESWARIEAVVDGSPSAFSHPSAILFQTTAVDEITHSPRMVIKNDGKVGIGTVEPSQMLEVAGGQLRSLDVPGSSFDINNNDRIASWIRAGARGLLVYENTDHMFFGLKNEGVNRNDAVIQWGDDRGFDTTTKGDALRFVNYLNIDQSEVERMRITPDGNVGIGTTNPERPLRVIGPSGSAHTAAFTDSTELTGVAVGHTDLIPGKGSIQAFDDNYPGADPNRYVDLILNSSGGNVGIGREPETHKLEVEGDAGKTDPGDWSTNSDIRIKTDVQDLENALDVINQLRPVKFHYTDEYIAEHNSITKDRYYYNFIAQEFQQVFPDSVTKDEEGYLWLDIHNIKPYLVAAVQEMDTVIKELKSENEVLKDRIEALERAFNKQ